ncbi:MAG: hypothetical protein Q8K55_11230 [Gemmatimonadaceae bacterium]|nr:hypothetical protein [Gemmatimonadaceae bacterium]
MNDRRYNEQEVAEIFGRAAEAQGDATRALTPGEGMTLAELQDIGQQVGMTAAAVADAARSLDRHEPRFRRQLLGLTIGVGRSVELERRLTTDEWERLVVKVRETFDARGNVKSEGSLRQWTNGNLQVLVEPTEHGDRLRIRTVNAYAQLAITAGVGTMAVPVLVAAVAMVAGVPDVGERLAPLAPLALMGAASIGVGLMRLRGWARTRLQQMDAIADWVRKQAT